MLAMSRALTTDPKVLLLDELSSGLAPLVVAELYEIVAQLAADGLAILLVEQSVRAALSVASRAAVMAGGLIIATGNPDEIEAAATEVYLGTARASDATV